MLAAYNRPMQDRPTFSFGGLTLREFVDRLASAEPAPGGGSASAVAASLGAALVAMVAALSTGRPRYAEHAPLHAEIHGRGVELAAELIRLADADAEAYAAYATALKRPKDGSGDGESVRAAALQRSARRAAEVPLETVEACLAVVTAAEVLAGRSNRNASSDLNVAATLAAAAARGAAVNVHVNLPALDMADPWAAAARARVDGLVTEIERLAEETRRVVLAAESRPPVVATPAGHAP